MEHTIATGLHRGLDYGERDRFTTAYFHHPDDLLRELADAGLAQEVVVSVEGPATFMSSLDDQLDDPARRNVLLRWLRRVETEPSLLGAGGHLIGLATVRGTD